MLLHVEPGCSHGQQLEHRRDLRQGSGRFIFFCRSFRSLNLGGKGSRVWRACNAARAWPVRCCARCSSPSEPSELLVRKLLLVLAGYLRAAPLQALPRCWLGSRRAPRTLQRQWQYRAAGWRGPGSGQTWFSVSPRFPATFSRLSGPSQPPPPPNPLVFFSVFFRPKNTCFFSVFSGAVLFLTSRSDAET